MHELGLSSRKPFKKCARVVGEVCVIALCYVSKVTISSVLVFRITLIEAVFALMANLLQSDPVILAGFG